MKLRSIITAVVLLSATFFYTISSNSADGMDNYFVKNKDALPATSNQDASLPASQHLESIVLGAGCFWGAEKRYQAIPGVVNAISGYAGGKNVRATYSEITRSKNRFNPDNHAEVVQVIFNNSMVSLETILENYFEGHDPTQVNRQGNDIGTQYRSTILTGSAEQDQVAKKVSSQYQTLLSEAGYGQVATKIQSLNKFYSAEEYHQDYLAKNPNGYCPDHSTGIKFDSTKAEQEIVSNDALLKGKHIVIIESEHYCPYCEKFKANVVKDYKGTIPMTFRLATQLEGLAIKTATWATPTVLFLHDGKEVFGKQGYMSPKQFYQALGAFKLGKGESYNVAFNEGTDGRYCKQYEIFKNTPDGIFIDKLSGAQLFDTEDRFNSKSGWLSFTKPIDGSVVELADNSYGMSRVEIRSKSSNIHLGHVFPDGPNGQSRYCINATVLEFVARRDI